MIDDCGPQLVDHWPLPDTAHRPGRTPRPVDGPVFAAARAAPAPTDAAAWPTNTAYLYGFALYRGGFYWEAHEVWEAVWAGCPPNARERFLLQALIQLANAGLKRDLGRPAAVARLLAHADRLLADVAPLPDAGQPQCSVMGVDVTRLRHAVHDAAVAANAAADEPSVGSL